MPTMTFPCQPATTGNCSATFPVPPGTDTFVVVDQDAYGNQLSRATFQQACAAGANTTIHAVLRGVVASASLALQTSYAPMGTPFKTQLIVTARDSSGQVIVGSGDFSQPITLVDSDTTGGTSLSETSVSAPTDVVTLSYDGVSYVDATITSPQVTLPLGIQPPKLIPILPATEYPIPSGSTAQAGMVLGSDGNVWFSETRSIARVTPAGAISEFPLGARFGPSGLAVGSDGNVWFDGATDNGSTGMPDVGNIATTGAITSFPITSSVYPLNFLTKGPDGNIWFAFLNTSIGKVTPQGTITRYSPTTAGGLSIQAVDLVTGPDGNLWLADGGGTIDKYVIATGALTEYPGSLPGTFGQNQNTRIVVGADNDFYYTTGSNVTKMNVSGVVLASYPFDDENLSSYLQMASAYNAVWTPLQFPGPAGHILIARIGTNGQYSELALPAIASTGSMTSGVSAIALGGDKTVWYARGTYVGHFAAH